MAVNQEGLGGGGGGIMRLHNRRRDETDKYVNGIRMKRRMKKDNPTLIMYPQNDSL